jgi:hypothetical protein
VRPPPNWAWGVPASTNSTAPASTPAPTVRPTPGRPAVPAAITIRNGPLQSPPCSPSSCPPSRPPPIAPPPASCTAAWAFRLTAPACAAGLSRTTRPQILATSRPRSPSNAGKFATGALYDASPHAWLPSSPDKQVLLELIDDATRYNTGARLYPSETLLSHFDFLSRTFQAHGLPLALYVDYHSFFYTHNPDAFTQLGAALHFYGVALRYAPTPQAKGKIERRHDYWQKRLPPLLAADQILELCGANHLLDQLLPHANQHEIHRELGTTPHAARDLALTEKRSVLRPAPACPWWPYVWSQRTHVRVGEDGKVPIHHQRHSIAAPPRSTVVRCLRPDGDLFYLHDAPDPNTHPLVLLHCPVF